MGPPLCFADRSQAHLSTGGHQQSGLGHRFVGVLPERGMGYSQRARGKTRKVLSLLHGTVRRYILQHNPATEDPVLHGQPDRALRGHLLPVGARFLSASGFQGENLVVHHHPPVADHVLLAHIRNHTVHVAVATVARQVPAVHHVAGSPLRGRHHHHHQHPLPVIHKNALECNIFFFFFLL